MIFFGAESGNDDTLKQLDKGGTQTGDQIGLSRSVGEVRYHSRVFFCAGHSRATVEEVARHRLIPGNSISSRKIKKVNPRTEISNLYLYSPVPTEGSEMYKQVLANRVYVPAKNWKTG